MLEQAGYEVVLRDNHIEAEDLDHEGQFDLVLLTLHRKKFEEAAAYSERLRKRKPSLPILLLTDYGAFVPRGTLSPQVETGNPIEMLHEIAGMLAGSSHIREMDDGKIADHEDSSQIAG